MSKIGIIAGSGIDENLFTRGFRIVRVKTKYGMVLVKEGLIEGKNVVFLNRHGPKYCPPHQINFRGNIQALRQRGVEKIVATAAVGSMNPKIKPGDFLLLSDFIDFTRGRIEFFDPKSFTDVSFPYDEGLRRLIQEAAVKLKLKIHPSAVYVCTEGPRFESRAEIKMYRKLGADVVGMTQVPEVVLAREVNIPYSALAIVTNYAAGLQERVSGEEVITMMREKNRTAAQILLKAIESLS